EVLRGGDGPAGGGVGRRRGKAGGGGGGGGPAGAPAARSRSGRYRGCGSGAGPGATPWMRAVAIRAASPLASLRRSGRNARTMRGPSSGRARRSPARPVSGSAALGEPSRKSFARTREKARSAKERQATDFFSRTQGRGERQADFVIPCGSRSRVARHAGTSAE